MALHRSLRLAPRSYVRLSQRSFCAGSDEEISPRRQQTIDLVNLLGQVTQGDTLAVQHRREYKKQVSALRKQYMKEVAAWEAEAEEARVLERARIEAAKKKRLEEKERVKAVNVAAHEKRVEELHEEKRIQAVRNRDWQLIQQLAQRERHKIVAQRLQAQAGQWVTPDAVEGLISADLFQDGATPAAAAADDAEEGQAAATSGAEAGSVTAEPWKLVNGFPVDLQAECPPLQRPSEPEVVDVGGAIFDLDEFETGSFHSYLDARRVADKLRVAEAIQRVGAVKRLRGQWAPEAEAESGEQAQPEL